MSATTAAIKTIIFDLGGVILNIDYDLTSRAFANTFGIADFSSVFSQRSQSAFMDAFETKRMTAAEFCNHIRSLFPEETAAATDAKIVDCWNAMLLDIQSNRIEALKRLRAEGFGIFLLSNINSLHEAEVDKIIERDVLGGLYTWNGLFDRVFFSHHFGMRKPHPETFRKVLVEIEAEASTTLFLDDSSQHVEGAKLVGIHAQLVPKERELNLYNIVHDVLTSL
ncbi:HAD-superfamily hydrolase, subfamily IA, variant 3 [Chytriomyces sp. MP71]|nr:HAD-superfamily hydrolase, subfamily IA, variant 3 [Chytriomyces sp. MP71]